VRGALATAQPEEVERSFLHEAAHGVAGMLPEDLEEGTLTVPLGVSAWIVRSDIDLARACDVLMRLRTAIVEVSGLDRRSEPVPMLGGDRRTAVLNLAVYLDGLMERGSRCCGTSRVELAEGALELLDP
jgi:hypothetical protein